MPAHDPLLDAYRQIRRVDAPADTPWPGTLVHSEGAGTVLLVEVEALGEDWPGWLAPAESHLLAPMDVVRRSGGHLVAMTPCTERVDEFLRRRADAPLTDGERITLAVSVVRGVADAVRLPNSIASPGEWWLTEGGRPVFALQRSGRSIADASRDILDAIEARAGRGLSGVLGDIVETMSDAARLSRNHARLEQALFSVTPPEPLATTVFAPRLARDTVSADRSASFDEVLQGGDTLVGRLARHVDADLADAFSRATTAVWRRFRSERAPARKRPLLVAGVAAGAVIAAGLMWPVGGPATAQPDETSSSTPAETGTSADPAPSTVDGPDPVSTPVGGLETVVGGLETVLDGVLTSRAACGGDEECLAAVMEDASAAVSAGPVDLATTERRITLVDDFGGAAVLRVEAIDGRGTSQLVVLVRQDESWLIRDVHDVADQPQ